MRSYPLIRLHLSTVWTVRYIIRFVILLNDRLCRGCFEIWDPLLIRSSLLRHRGAVARLGRASKSRRREIKRIEKGGKVSTHQRGKTRVGSFARANIQHPQAEEEKKRSRRHAGLKSKGELRRELSGIVECAALLDLHPNYIDVYSTLQPHSELS